MVKQAEVLENRRCGRVHSGTRLRHARKRLLVQPLGPGVIAHPPIHIGQILQARRRVGMRVAEELLSAFERLFGHRPGVREFLPGDQRKNLVVRSGRFRDPLSLGGRHLGEPDRLLQRQSRIRRMPVVFAVDLAANRQHVGPRFLRRLPLLKSLVNRGQPFLPTGDRCREIAVLLSCQDECSLAGSDRFRELSRIAKASGLFRELAQLCQTRLFLLRRVRLLGRDVSGPAFAGRYVRGAAVTGQNGREHPKRTPGQQAEPPRPTLERPQRFTPSASRHDQFLPRPTRKQPPVWSRPACKIGGMIRLPALYNVTARPAVFKNVFDSLHRHGRTPKGRRVANAWVRDYDRSDGDVAQKRATA